MPKRPPKTSPLHPLRASLALLALAAPVVAGWAAAHATLVFGTVTTEPAPPRADQPFRLRLEMRDPVDAPVEDAVVLVEATAPDGVPSVETDRFEEIDEGVYATDLTLPEAGAWTLLFRDRTFRQEEAQATITLPVGADAATEPLSFIFPPTATGPVSLRTWLVWLIGLPLLAGVVVTLVVLRGGPASGADDDAGGAGSDGPEARGA